MADTFYSRLQKHIEDAQKNVPPDSILGVFFITPGGEHLIVQDVSYHNPNLIPLYCLDANGHETTVLAHMSTIQLVLKVLPKTAPEAPKRPIGFLRKPTTD